MSYWNTVKTVYWSTDRKAIAIVNFATPPNNSQALAEID